MKYFILATIETEQTEGHVLSEMRTHLESIDEYRVTVVPLHELTLAYLTRLWLFLAGEL